jgi:protein-S-isoprenylcysteine O-methyltransferase Ste14
MKFSNGTELRFATPKYSWIWRRLNGVGAGFFLLSMFISKPAKEWVGGIGVILILAGLVVLLAGTIAERKEWQAAHKIDDSK